MAPVGVKNCNFFPSFPAIHGEASKSLSFNFLIDKLPGRCLEFLTHILSWSCANVSVSVKAILDSLYPRFFWTFHAAHSNFASYNSSRKILSISIDRFHGWSETNLFSLQQQQASFYLLHNKYYKLDLSISLFPKKATLVAMNEFFSSLAHSFAIHYFTVYPFFLAL